MKILSLQILLFIIALQPLLAQDDLLSQLDGEKPSTENNHVTATFKGTRILNGQSVETRDKGVLDMIIKHRFGTINSGPYEFFGLDEANVRIGFDYGIMNNFNIGIGRNSFEKTFDGFLKYKILNQTASSLKNPVTVVIFSSAALNTLRSVHPDLPFVARISYTWQIMIARKFSQNFSLQISPTLVHKNMVQEILQKNDIYAIGLGGRHKLTKRLSVNAEYFHRLNPDAGQANFNSLSIGLDIETGGHVFQLHFSNSRAMIEKGFITETSGDFFKGDIHFGFNISRVFQIGHSSPK